MRLLLCLLLGMATTVTAEPDSLWSLNLGGGNWDRCNSIVATDDDGFLLGGETSSYGSGGYDFWVIKVSSLGEVEWTKTLGRNSWEDRTSVAKTSDGGYLIGGETDFGSAPPTLSTDVWIVKLSLSGDSLWSRSFGASGYYDACEALEETNDSGMILAGWTGSQNFEVNGLQGWLQKCDVNGDSLWMRDFGATSQLADVFYDVKETTNGGLVMAGVKNMFGSGYSSGDVWVVKTDGLGEYEWEWTWDGNSKDVGKSIVQSSDGGFVVCGYANTIDAQIPSDFFCAKLNSAGEEEWITIFGSPNDYEMAQSVIENEFGYLLAGHTNPYLPQVGYSDFWLAQLNFDGDTLWTQRWGAGPVSQECFALTADGNGGYVLAGEIYSYPPPDYNVWVLKVSENSHAPERPEPIDDFVLHAAYPNPFNPTTTISFDLAVEAEVSLKILDVLGREVATLVNETMSGGGHSAKFDASGLASGIYFCRLDAVNQTQIQKIVLLK